jgi:hypothetical protein
LEVGLRCARNAVFKDPAILLLDQRWICSSIKLPLARLLGLDPPLVDLLQLGVEALHLLGLALLLQAHLLGLLGLLLGLAEALLVARVVGLADPSLLEVANALLDGILSARQKRAEFFSDTFSTVGEWVSRVPRAVQTPLNALGSIDGTTSLRTPSVHLLPAVLEMVLESLGQTRFKRTEGTARNESTLNQE